MLKGWEFSKSRGLDDTKPTMFKPVELPHDWLIEDTQELYQNSIGWYKKEWVYDGKSPHISIRFDGVYMDATLFVNDSEVGQWKYGYSAFEFELTDYLIKGSNSIELRVVHQAPNSRWYTGAGIYRNVWIITRGRSYIESDGIYISTSKKGQTYDLEIDTDLIIEQNKGLPVVLTHIVSQNGELIAEVQAQAATSQTMTSNIKELNVAEWSPESPERYTLETTLYSEDKTEVIESQTHYIGFKSVEMIPDQGLLLNGSPYKIKGFCEHHDLGALGAAFSPSAMRYRMRVFKEMGVNAIRTSHNMPAKELMELADELGFLIASESFDMWERPKTPYDYARFFKDWASKDVKSWVKRDRNHVSLLLWTIGNEIYDTHADERGLILTDQLTEWVKEYDPKGNAPVTLGSNYMPWEHAQKCADLLKIVGYNYGEKYYDDHHADHPDWVIYGSETGSVVQSRGIYHFPFKQSVLADDDEQCSALGNSSTSWGAKSPERILTGERDRPYSMGQFVWTGFDYIGEPTPYHTKNSYFGQIDTANFPKDSYYIYQSAWTDFKDKPMLHVFPYWDFNPGQTIDVRVATNAPRVALYLNDVQIGDQRIDHQRGQTITPTWQVSYEPGEIKAVAYDENDNVVIEKVRHSFKDAHTVVLTPERTKLKANGQDLIFVEVSALDEDEHPVDNATNRVELHVSGAGRLVGYDNGDSTDYDQYKGTSRRLFSGKAMAIIQATEEVGPIIIEAESEGLSTSRLVLSATETDEPIEHDVIRRNTHREILTGQSTEVPIRKIELISENGRQCSPDNREVTVKAILHPSNTSYTDIEWSVVNDAGVEATNVSMTSEGNRAYITAKGDGSFRVRCTSKNGTDSIKLISELDMDVTGLGTAYKNPYTLVSGSLFDDSKGEVTNGNERGIATSRDGETVVGYHDIDFGKYGSDTITLPVFALTSEEYTIGIWEGHPDAENSLLLLDAVYQKESQWNVYQEEIYTLNKSLKGITTLYFVMQAKVHLKGFYFEEFSRAFAYNSAGDADAIYGDDFTRSGKQVRNIGNNVSLVFEDIDFGDQSADKIRLVGHSPIDKNTIHVRFVTEEGESDNQVIDFTRTLAIEEKTVDLSPLHGKGTLTFVFLPGSQFDFEGFEFLEANQLKKEET
ncbi:MAG: DUF4982 domain-containing protein [Alkalibacterium sp.]|nr:DUF4982 domain-containing protein [Alkalibacterium sp.]